MDLSRNLLLEFYLLRFPSESLMVFFTSSFPGLKNLSFSETNPFKGILFFSFSKSLTLTSIHFCCHISRCQTQEPSLVPSVTSAITTSCSRKEHRRKINKKNQPDLLFKARSWLGREVWSKPPQKHSGTQHRTCSSSACICAGSGTWLRQRARKQKLEVLPRAGVPAQDTAACSTGEPQAGSLGLILSASLPRSLPCLFQAEILCKVVL